LNILAKVNKIPGGIMLVPLGITAVINTLFPNVLKIGGPFSGAFTSVGTMTVIGMMLFIQGSQVRINEVGKALARGSVLVATRLFIGFGASWIMLTYFGKDGFMGLSTLAVVSVLASSNPGVYMGLMQSYGDNVDKTALGMLNIIAVPATALVLIDMAGGGGFNYMLAVTTLAPFIIGMILGNSDEKIRGIFVSGLPVILPFLGCCFGSTINLRAFYHAGFADLILISLVVFVSVPIMVTVDRLILKRPGYAAAAISTVGGTAVPTPMIIAQVLPQYQPYVEVATAQVALAVILAVIIVPNISKYIATKYGCGTALSRAKNTA